MKKLLIFLCVFSLFTACNNPPQEQPKPKEMPLKDTQQTDVISKTENNEENNVNPLSPLSNFGKYDGENPLCNAIEAGNLEKVKETIKNVENVNPQELCIVDYELDEGCDFTPLTLAIVKGNFDVVQELIKAGADINKKSHCETSYGGEGGDDYYLTPLYVSMKGIPFGKKGVNKDIAKELIKAGADVNIKDDYGNTLLELSDDTEITQMLLKYGAKDSLVAAINRKDLQAFNKLLKSSNLESKNQALAKSVALNDIFLTEELIKAGANVNTLINANRYPNEGCPNETPLAIALNGKHIEITELLKKHGAKELMCEAIYSQDLQRVREVIKNGKDPNKEYIYCVPFDCDNITPIDHAISTKNLEIIKEFIESGVKVDLNEALMSVTCSGNSELVKYFIELGADVNAKQGFPLIDAVRCRHSENVKLLLDKGADVNIPSANGRTPLFYADRKEIAELLISRGADVNWQDEHWQTPIFDKDKEVVELLISKGANVNVRGDCGQTPLSVALMRGELRNEIAKLLISKSANVNYHEYFNQPACKNWRGDTTLTAVVDRKNTEMVKLLLEKGANVNEKNAEGKTPLDIALKEGYTEIVELLKAAGAK